MSDFLAVLHRLRWPLALSIALLIAAFGGRVMGDMASENIAPFYANVVVPNTRSIADRRLADAPAAGVDDAGNGVTVPVDLGYSSAAAAAADRNTEPPQ